MSGWHIRDSMLVLLDHHFCAPLLPHPTRPSPVPMKLGQRWMTHQSMENVVTSLIRAWKMWSLITHQSMENVVTYHSSEHGKCGHLSLIRAWKMWSLITHQSMENVVTYHSSEHGKCGHLSLTKSRKMWSHITHQIMENVVTYHSGLFGCFSGWSVLFSCQWLQWCLCVCVCVCVKC